MFNPTPFLADLREHGKLAAAAPAAAVLLVYLSHMLKQGHAWPTLETVGRLAGLSERAARRQRAQLVAAGILVPDGGKGRGGYVVPVFKLGNLLTVKRKSAQNTGFSAHTGGPLMAAQGARPRPPRGAANGRQNVKQDLNKNKEQQNTAAGGLAAAAVAALGEVGITGKTLEHLAGITPPIDAQDVREAITRAGKARARSVTGWAVSWLKSPDRLNWRHAQDKRTAAAAAAAAAEKEKRRTAAAAAAAAAALDRSLSGRLASMTPAQLERHRGRYIDQLPIPAMRLKIGALPMADLLAGQGFRAFIAQEVRK